MTSQLLNDRYQIIRTLGEGGFGETFLAEDTHMPSKRHCVVKRLRPVAENPQINQLVQERFQREAAILEELGNGHNQIPSLYAYFYLPADQQFYLVQEWIDGDTLGAIARQQGRVNETEVRRILAALLPVFDYIHGKSIIHRDVKPENVIVRHSDRQPVLIDFGAVRETMGAALNSQGRPTQSIVIGTPGYMPSEQSIGRPVYNSDLYSLGMTAIYLLTGKQPQEFISNPVSGEIDWRSDAPQVSSQLANILDKAISSHPRDRYQTATEFLAAVQGTASTTKDPALNAPTAATWVVAPAAAATAQHPVTDPAPRRDSQLPLIGGLVVGSVLGGAALAAVFLRSPSPSVVPVAVVSPTPITSTTPSPEDRSPSSTESIAPTTSVAASSVASSAVAPSPSLTTTPTTTTATSPPSYPSASSRPSADDSSPSPVNTTGEPAENQVATYYQAINSRNYPAAWQMLPADLRASTTTHPQGYRSFTEWWDSIAAVDVVKIRTARQGVDRSLVNVRAIYRMKNGQSVPFILKYMMVWDAASQQWVIARISR